MRTSDLINRAYEATTVVDGRPYLLMAAGVTLADGRRLGVDLVRVRGRSAAIRPHYRADFYLDGRKVSRDKAERVLLEAPSAHRDHGEIHE